MSDKFIKTLKLAQRNSYPIDNRVLVTSYWRITEFRRGVKQSEFKTLKLINLSAMTYLASVLILTLFSGIIYCSIKFSCILRSLRKRGKMVDQFPMDEKHWFYGHLHKYTRENMLSRLEQLTAKYPRVCGVHLINFIRPYVVVHHPDTVKVVVKACGGKAFSNGFYGYGRKWFGESLLFSSGAKWFRNRRLLSPTFHFDALKHYVKIHNEAADIFLMNLSSCAKREAEAEVQKLSSHLAFDIILRCAMSYHSRVQEEGVKNAYINAVGVLSKLWMKRSLSPLKHFDFLYWMTSEGKQFLKNCDIIHDLANKLIRERRTLLKEHPDEAEGYHDFLDILLRSKDEDGVGLTDQEIRDEVNTFAVAGYETTAGSIAWILYSLATNPVHQKICQKEIDDMLRGRPDDRINWNDLQQLPYLTMCIKEALRLYCIPLLEKKLDEDVVIDGKLVHADTLVIINLFGLHRHPQIWKDPSKFDPERFSRENVEQRDPYAYIPFFVGSRNCIGQSFALEEMRVVLARALKKFDFSASDNHEPMKRNNITIRSINGIYLKISERSTKVFDQVC